MVILAVFNITYTNHMGVLPKQHVSLTKIMAVSLLYVECVHFSEDVLAILFFLSLWGEKTYLTTVATTRMAVSRLQQNLLNYL